MIPDKPDLIVETNLPNSKSFKFRFEADRHLFDAFSKNLYSNPHDSMVREVISNAVDANTRAGKNHSSLTVIINNNEFIVKDEGGGISEEKMETVVGVYGKSDKRDTNEEIGMYGFGFKSPFAVSDQFIVETVPGDGYKYIWLIYKDLSGSGEIKLANKEKTTESTHTKVRVPIKPTEFYKIKEATRKYTMFMYPEPILFTNENTIHTRIKIKEEDVNWIQTELKVQYDVLYDGWMPYCSNKTVNCNLLIKFNKNELKFSPSREQIKTTEEFNNIFDSKKNEYWNFIKKHVQTNVIKTNDLHEVVKFILSSYKQYKDFFGSEKNFKFEIDHPIFGKLNFPNQELIDKSVLRFNYNSSLIKESFFTAIKDIENFILVYLPTEEANKIYNPYTIRKLKFVVNKYRKTPLFITKDDITSCKDNLVSNLFKTAINLNDVKLPPSCKPSSGFKYKKGFITVKDGNNRSIQVDVNNGEYIYTVNKYEFDSFVSLKNRSGIQYCKIRSNHLKKIKDLSNWNSPKQYIEGVLKQIKQTDIDDIAYNESLDKTNIVVKSIAQKKQINIKDDDITIVQIGRYLGLTQSKNEYISDKINEEFYKKYPLIKYIQTYYYNDCKKYINDYIKLIDGEK